MLLLCGAAAACSPGYYLRATYEQANILIAREDITDALSSNEVSQDQKEKLALVQEVQEWTKTKGFYASDSYTKYADIGRDKLVFVLSAAPKTSLKPKTWWFPFVGTVPYKGFFDEADAREEAKELEEEGYDTYVRESVAYSTLGWFDDPVLNTMLKLNKVSLANTIIHETFHQTVWIKDEAVFNESLANVVGAVGAVQYFEEKGQEAEEAQARAAIDKLVKVSKLLEELETALKEVYQNNTEADALAMREQVYKNLMDKWGASLGEKVNNAFIVGKLTYYRKTDELLSAYENCDQSLECLIAKAKKIETDPWGEILN